MPSGGSNIDSTRDLSDVQDTAPSDGDVLLWVAANSRYEPGPASGSFSIQGASDFGAGPPSDGDTLIWVAANSRFEPQAVSGAVSSVTAGDASLTISPTTGGVVASLNTANFTAWTGGQQIIITDGTAGSQVTPMSFAHRSSTTPVAGFGLIFGFQLDTDTNALQAAASLAISWVDPGNSTRLGRFSILVDDFNGEKEAARFDTDGTLSRSTFGGSSITTASAIVTVGIADTGTTNTPDLLTLGHTSSGTPAAGFGATQSWRLKSSTTDDQPAASEVVSWATATHASRAARRVRNVYYTSTAQEIWREEAASDQARTAIGGAVVGGQRLTTYCGVATDVGHVIKGATSQSANLHEWRASDNTLLASINSGGQLVCPSGVQARGFAVGIYGAALSAPGGGSNAISSDSGSGWLWLRGDNEGGTVDNIRFTDNASVVMGTFNVSGGFTVRAGASTTYAKVGGSVKDWSADAGNVDATGETDLNTWTSPANFLATNNDGFFAEFAGDFNNALTASVRLRVYFGGTNGYDSTAFTLAADTDWNLKVFGVRVSSTVVRITAVLATTGATGAVYTKTTEITGLTLSSTNIIKLTGQSTGTGKANNDIVSRLATIPWKAAA